MGNQIPIYLVTVDSPIRPKHKRAAIFRVCFRQAGSYVCASTTVGSEQVEPFIDRLRRSTFSCARGTLSSADADLRKTFADSSRLSRNLNHPLLRQAWAPGSAGRKTIQAKDCTALFACPN